MLVKTRRVSVPITLKPHSLTLPVKSFVGVPPGGSPHQVLTKKTGANHDVAWESPEAASIAGYDPGDINLVFENQLI